MWYPTVLHKVNIINDRASIMRNYGESTQDRIVLNIPYEIKDSEVGNVKTLYYNPYPSDGIVPSEGLYLMQDHLIGGKKYLLPKQWEKQTNDMLAKTMTFNDRDGFDFFAVGDCEITEPVSDEDYLDGFYDYMNDKYDEVYAITSVSKFTVIPHFEITGK